MRIVSKIDNFCCKRKHFEDIYFLVVNTCHVGSIFLTRRPKLNLLLIAIIYGVLGKFKMRQRYCNLLHYFYHNLWRDFSELSRSSWRCQIAFNRIERYCIFNEDPASWWTLFRRLLLSRMFVRCKLFQSLVVNCSS